MTPTTAEQLADVQQLLERADHQGRSELQIGSIILAVQHLADIVEAQDKRIKALQTYIDMNLGR